MFKYVDLAVDLKQGRKCKDALINYRNTVQQVNVQSLEDVIRHLVAAATERAEGAQREAQARLDDVADLEADASPEELMLSYVSGEKSSDRTDRDVVTPWFKFLWETHRNALDVLRNNSRLEALYAAAAGRAFAFCLTHKRTTEFRRLCDILRNHLATLIRYKDQGGQHRTELTNPPTWELYVDMRFEQLRTACDLELWAEAFRSVEDIQGLVNMSPKGMKVKPALQATYYTRLTQIFSRSEARLYNAYAWYRLFTNGAKPGSRTTGPGAEEQRATAMHVVLSALSVMPYQRPDIGMKNEETGRTPEQERAVKMATILGFSVVSFCRA
jgi:translation initiation factor 3 subunit A